MAGAFVEKQRLAVLYHKDRILWHERVVLYHLGSARYLPLSPDLEILNEDTSGQGLLHSVRTTLRPDGLALGVRRQDFYKFEDQGGYPSDAELDGREHWLAGLDFEHRPLRLRQPQAALQLAQRLRQPPG